MFPRISIVLSFFILLHVTAFTFADSLRLTVAQVEAGAEVMYRQRITALERSFHLDADSDFLIRLDRLASPLIEQAKVEHPESVKWQWEIHASSDPLESSYCMAGGKVLVSQNQVSDLDLNDIELSMLISHEMQHALLSHHFEEYAEALRLFPGWKNRPFGELELAVDNDETFIRALSQLNRKQELDADSNGLKMAVRAGLPASRLTNFFKKLLRNSAQKNVESNTHPSTTYRWFAIKEIEKELAIK